jgi:hypothetical protein
MSNMDLWKMGCEAWRWMELAQDHVHWWAVVLLALNLWCVIRQLVCTIQCRNNRGVQLYGNTVS